MAADQYASLATDYHWFFDDRALRLGCDTPGVRAVMAGLPPGARVLDAACGIGVDAAALARRSLQVSCSDASADMIDVARERLGASVDRLVVSSWADLPAHFEPAGFDAVFCIGNSIAHAEGGPAMVASFEAFRSLLVPGGTLVLDSQDWELIHASGSHVSIEPVIVERDGRRCVRTYSWHVAAGFGEPCELETAAIFLDGGRASLRSFHLRMWPYTRAELRRRLAVAGFERITLDAIPGDDRYTAVAHRPPA